MKRGNPNFGTQELGRQFVAADSASLPEALAKKPLSVKLPQSHDDFIRSLSIEERGPFIRRALAAAIEGDLSSAGGGYSPEGVPVAPWPRVLVEAVDSTLLRKMAASVGISSRDGSGRQKSKNALVEAIDSGGFLL